MKVTVWLHWPKGMTSEAAESFNPATTTGKTYPKHIWKSENYDTYRCEIDVPVPDQPVVARGVAEKVDASYA